MEFTKALYKEREISDKIYLDNIEYKGELKKSYFIFECKNSGRNLVVFKDQRELLEFMIAISNTPGIVAFKLLKYVNNKYRYRLDMAHTDEEYVYTVASACKLDIGEVITISNSRDIIIS